MPPQLHAKPHGASRSRLYLLTYNILCAIFWLRILLSTITTLVASPQVSAVYASLETWTRWTQTLAVLEILHAALGIPRPLSELIATSQLTSRIFRSHPISRIYYIHASFCPFCSGLGYQLCISWRDGPLASIFRYGLGVVYGGCNPLFVFCCHAGWIPRPTRSEMVKVSRISPSIKHRLL